jgi:hypothetical protein
MKDNISDLCESATYEGMGVWILYLSNNHTLAEHLWSASTSPYENDYWPPDSIDKLLYNFASFLKTISSMKVSLYTNRTTSFQRSITFCERIRKIFRLNFNGTKRIPFSAVKLIDMMIDLLSTPCLDTTRLIPRLDQLISLKVSLSNHYKNQSDLQVLLNQAPNLYSLSVGFSTMSTLDFFQVVNIRHASVRKLSFERMWYNKKQYSTLSRSTLEGVGVDVWHLYQSQLTLKPEIRYCSKHCFI